MIGFKIPEERLPSSRVYCGEAGAGPRRMEPWRPPGPKSSADPSVHPRSSEGTIKEVQVRGDWGRQGRSAWPEKGLPVRPLGPCLWSSAGIVIGIESWPHCVSRRENLDRHDLTPMQDAHPFWHHYEAGGAGHGLQTALGMVGCHAKVALRILR